MSPAAVYLVDHYAYKPPDEYRLTREGVNQSGHHMLKNTCFNKGQTEEERAANEKEVAEILEFMERVWQKSGLSENFTHLPPSINPKCCGTQPKTDLNAAYAECHEATCGAVEGLLTKTGLSPTDVDILITTCSIYCPTPSMASMVVNHFKMRHDIQSYHLGGMGCSTGVGGVCLVRDLLKAWPNSNVVFVTNEVVTPAFYAGKDKSKLVPNMLFRMGAAAALFSNKKQWVRSGQAKYKLVNACKVNTAARDDSYRCIWYGPDDQGINGVSLSKEVVTEASRALTLAMKATAPHVMTTGQIVEFLVQHWKRKYAKAKGQSVPAPYTPRFNKGVQHFLLHAGGAKVLEGLGKGLQLEASDLEPSRAVLYDYGNVSSSTTWYTLGYIETVRGVKAGDKVLQVGVGSGIKCATCVWKAVRDVDELHKSWDRVTTPERRAAVSARTGGHRRQLHPDVLPDSPMGKHKGRLASSWLVPPHLLLLLLSALVLLVRVCPPLSQLPSLISNLASPQA